MALKKKKNWRTFSHAFGLRPEGWEWARNFLEMFYTFSDKYHRQSLHLITSLANIGLSKPFSGNIEIDIAEGGAHIITLTIESGSSPERHNEYNKKRAYKAHTVVTAACTPQAILRWWIRSDKAYKKHRSALMIIIILKKVLGRCRERCLHSWIHLMRNGELSAVDSWNKCERELPN